MHSRLLIYVYNYIDSAQAVNYANNFIYSTLLA